MSFTGDLEHLPIVDVIQLLQSTRKSGTLCLKSHKGESQLVFNDGYIVSANHANNNVRIGRILLEMNAITDEELVNALNEQRSAGADRIPLIAALLEGGKIKKEAAFKGLETLVEMTIVEVLTWAGGTFSLDVDKMAVSDDYRYFPEKLHQDFFLNTQSVLMEALRIYDEKMRDGTLTDETFSTGEASPEGTFDSQQEGPDISVDDLGLGDLDNLESKIPDIFLGLKDHDPVETHRQKIGEDLQGIPHDEQEKFFSYLAGFSGSARSGEDHAPPAGPDQAIILFSRDRFIEHTVATVCKHEGFFVFTTDDEVNLDPIIDQSLSKGLVPILVIDAPEKIEGGFPAENIASLRQQKLAKYPRISLLQLASPEDYEFSLHALQAGARAVLPRPRPGERKETFVADTITFLDAFRSYLKKSFPGPDQQVLDKFKECFVELGTLKEAPEVSLLLLRFASVMFERSITFVVGKSELIAERGIGVKADRGAGATPPMRFKIPRARPSIFQDVIENGHLFYGQSSDAILKSHLFGEIGAPHSSKILLLPIKTSGRVIALIYGDFGPKAGSPVHIDLLDILARHAALVLDNAFYRKKFEKTSQPD